MSAILSQAVAVIPVILNIWIFEYLNILIF
jgi:hypothetical protein